MNIINLTVTKGSTPNSGGGIYIGNGTVNLTNSTISGNSAGDGGGILKSSGTLTLTNSTISGNSATRDGGGIYSLSGLVTLNNSTVSGNSAPFGIGGGIYITLGRIDLTNSTLSGNSARSSIGGGIAISGYQTTANLTNSTVSDNSGGIYTNNIINTANLTNSTVSDNKGNGIHINYGNVNLTNSTVANNTGNGIYLYYAPSNPGTITLTNSIVANNGGDCSYYTANRLSDEGYNLASDNSCGLTKPSSLFNTNPLLVHLANNCGPTKTKALLPESPAIDWIPLGTNGCSKAITDQRGVSRPQGLACDIGAFEYDSTTTTCNTAPHAAPTGGGSYQISAPITVGGQVSDFDNDPLDYTWHEGTTLYCRGSVRAPVNSLPGTPINLPDCALLLLSLGTHTITLTVSDGISQPVSSNITVTVIDSTAPTLSPDPDKSILWPPNHQMVNITIDTHASDNSGPPTLSTVVDSNEPQNGLGDGDTAPDWKTPVINQATGMITLQLRAERSGSGNGRVYTIAITATDSSGNASIAPIKILVPHDKGK